MKQKLVLDKTNPHAVRWSDGRLYATFIDAREAELLVEMCKRFSELRTNAEEHDMFNLAHRYFTQSK
jgi:pantothenate kinase